MSHPTTSHFPALITDLLDWSQEHDSPPNHARLLRGLAATSTARLQQHLATRHFAHAATAALISAHRTRHPKSTTHLK